jgi:hypothetical protein
MKYLLTAPIPRTAVDAFIAEPQSWSGDKIIHEVGDIVTSPKTQWYAQKGTGGLYTKNGDPATWVAYKVREFDCSEILVGAWHSTASKIASGVLYVIFPKCRILLWA